MGLGSTLGMAAGGVGGFMVGGPAGAMVGAGLGGSVGGMFDGQDAPQQAQAQQIDPNDPRYRFGENGGVGQGAIFDRAAGIAASREAPTTNYAQANGDYAMQLQARAQQQGLANRLTGILDGTGPATQAQLQLQRGQQDAIEAGQQMAASARGTNALLQARSANVGAVLGAQRANQDAAMLRAREEAQARGELANVVGGMRAADMGSRAESAGQSQFQTQTQMQQRGMNDAQELGLFGLANDARQSQLDANVRIAQGNQGGANSMAMGNAQLRSEADQRERAGKAAMYGGLAQAGVGMMSGSKPAAGGASNPSQASNGGYGNNPYTYGGGGVGSPQAASAAPGTPPPTGGETQGVGGPIPIGNPKPRNGGVAGWY